MGKELTYRHCRTKEQAHEVPRSSGGSVLLPEVEQGKNKQLVRSTSAYRDLILKI